MSATTPSASAGRGSPGPILIGAPPRPNPPVEICDGMTIEAPAGWRLRRPTDPERRAINNLFVQLYAPARVEMSDVDPSMVHLNCTFDPERGQFQSIVAHTPGNEVQRSLANRVESITGVIQELSPLIQDLFERDGAGAAVAAAADASPVASPRSVSAPRSSVAPSEVDTMRRDFALAAERRELEFREHMQKLVIDRDAVFERARVEADLAARQHALELAALRERMARQEEIYQMQVKLLHERAEKAASAAPKDENPAQLKRIHTAHEQQVAALLKDHRAEMDRLLRAHQESLLKQREDLSAINADLQKQLRAAQSAIDSQRESFTRDLARMEEVNRALSTDLAASKKRTAEELELGRAQLLKEYGARLEEQQKTFHDRNEALMAELRRLHDAAPKQEAAFSAQLREVQTELAHLRESLQKLAAEKEALLQKQVRFAQEAFRAFEEQAAEKSALLATIERKNALFARAMGLADQDAEQSAGVAAVQSERACLVDFSEALNRLPTGAPPPSSPELSDSGLIAIDIPPQQQSSDLRGDPRYASDDDEGPSLGVGISMRTQAPSHSDLVAGLRPMELERPDMTTPFFAYEFPQRLPGERSLYDAEVDDAEPFALSDQPLPPRLSDDNAPAAAVQRPNRDPFVVTNQRTPATWYNFESGSYGDRPFESLRRPIPPVTTAAAPTSE